MGRPLNKRYFGPLATADDPLNAPLNDEKFNVTTAVKVGTASATTNGYILAQRSTTSFLVNDLPDGTKRTISGSGTGNVGVCRLVDKDVPEDNEMVIVGELETDPTVLTGDITDADPAGDAIVFTSAGHGLSAGDEVTVTGVVPNDFNGTYTIESVTTDTFTIDPLTNEFDPYVSGGEFTASIGGTDEVRISKFFNRTCRDFNDNRYKWTTEAVSATETKLVLTSL